MSIDKKIISLVFCLALLFNAFVSANDIPENLYENIYTNQINAGFAGAIEDMQPYTHEQGEDRWVVPVAKLAIRIASIIFMPRLHAPGFDKN